MSDDVYTETSTEGWFSRIGKSFVTVLIGFVLFVLSFPLLWWNEGNAVRTAADYAAAKDVTVDVDPKAVDAAANGKLVHLSGLATTDETLSDEQFGVVAPAIRLVRSVEMYQWDQEEHEKKEKKLGGGETTVTTYEYKKVWANHAINSSGFKKPNGHQNPGSLPFPSREFQAKKTTLGAYTLSDTLVSQISKSEPLPVKPDDAAKPLEKADPTVGTPVPEATGDQPAPAAEPVNLDGFEVVDGQYYRGTPRDPQVGDVRVSFSVVKPTDVSVLARQNGDTFEGWAGPAGTNINRLMLGVMSKDAMFEQLATELSIFTWIVRFGGFMMMFIGLSSLSAPLAVLADVVPLLGDLVRMGTGLFAGILAAFLTLTTIALAWLFYRPLIGLALLALAVAIIVGAYMLFGKKKELPAQFSPEGA